MYTVKNIQKCGRKIEERTYVCPTKCRMLFEPSAQVIDINNSNNSPKKIKLSGMTVYRIIPSVATTLDHVSVRSSEFVIETYTTSKPVVTM
jgi:hypothetical protein